MLYTGNTQMKRKHKYQEYYKNDHSKQRKCSSGSRGRGGGGVGVGQNH